MKDSSDFDPEMLKNAMMGGFYFAETKKESKKLRRNSSKKYQVLDLHFEKLYPELSYKTATEKLDLQLLELEQFLIRFRKSNLRKTLIITGKGNGVLLKSVKKHLDENGIRYNVVIDPPFFGGALTLLKT